MKRKLISVLLAALMILSLGSGIITVSAEAPEPFEWTLYYNYEWWGLRPWGGDDISAYWSDLFNMNIIHTKADSSPEDQFLQLMVLSDDLPDVVMMDRGPVHMDLCRQGIFQDLAPLQANNPMYDENILASTQELLKIDGVLYSIPHWARKGPTGGNNMWLYNENIWKAAGSPDLATFEDLYAYAKAVKENVPTNESGAPTIAFAGQNNNDGWDVLAGGFYRSFGGPNRAGSWTIRLDGKIQSVFRDPVFKEATLELNKWYREGLLLETQFTDTNDQMIEKFSTGRVGLLYYDHSQDSVNRFRRIMMDNEPGNGYGRVIDPVYPPRAGVTKTYADEKPSIGWNVLCITKDAKEPQRIFDFLSYMLSKQGSIDMMYGPPGVLYDALDSEGNPILTRPMAEVPTEEIDKVGTWIWSFCNQSDNVDDTKFAVNKMQPPELQDWVEQTQSDILTPIMFVTDEYVNLNTTIDPLSDLGISRTRCEDQIRTEMPKICMAPTEEEASKLYDELLAFLDANDFPEVEAAYDVLYQENIKLQGFSSYSDYD